MHGLSRFGSARSATSSPPSSPSFRLCRNKSFAGSRVGGGGGTHSLVEKLVMVLISAVFKRKGVLLVAPLLYISVMLLYMSSYGFDVVDLKSVVAVRKRAPPGSLYRSPQVFQKLWPFMQAEANDTNSTLVTAWNSKVHQAWKPCADKSNSEAELPKSNGFLIIEANGGLNQQRLSGCTHCTFLQQTG